MVFFFGLPQRLVVWPLAVLLPRKREAIVGWWYYAMATATIGISRWVADVRVEFRGSIPPGPCVALMNHQSLLDIPILYSLVRHPYPLVPTRALYARGIPGISPLIRMGELPLVAQSKDSQRRDLKDIAHAAERVAGGERSLGIFPEGHRTKDGAISPFMKAGLRIILPRTRERPVYLIVEDGFWHARTAADALFSYAGTRGRVQVAGPFTLPATGDVNPFIEEMQERMVAMLAEIRAEPRS
jgi:1-acyl-sn-glycerol-3-phosphate acyltransferase